MRIHHIKDFAKFSIHVIRFRTLHLRKDKLYGQYLKHHFIMQIILVQVFIFINSEITIQT